MRTLRVCAITFALAVALFLVRHWTWGNPQPSFLSIVVGNCVDVAHAPGWAVTRLISGHWVVDSRAGRMVVSATSAIVWVGAIWLWLHLRSRIVGLPTPPARPSSRRLLLRTAVMDIPAGLLAGSAVTSLLAEPWTIPLGRYRVPIKDLHPRLEGLRIIQISDTHLGERIPLGHLQSVVRKTLSLRPDLICLTGDYIHNGKRFIPDGASVFAPLTAAGIPVVGVLGNHDWYGDGRAMADALRAQSVVMIDNDRVFLDTTRNLSAACVPGLCLAGVGDLMEHVVNPQSAFAGVPAEMPRLLLSHNPDVAELPSLASHRVDLQLSGHTHGGQVRIPFYGPLITLSKFGARYAAGLNQGPVSPVLTSRGIGMSILPIRFMCSPELVEITLVRAAP